MSISIGASEPVQPARDNRTRKSTRKRCILCNRVFSVPNAGSDVSVFGVRCPTLGCESAPAFWVNPGDPLLDERAWKDWEQALDIYDKLESEGELAG